MATNSASTYPHSEQPIGPSQFRRHKSHTHSFPSPSEARFPPLRRSGFPLATIMPTSAGWATLVSQHLRAAKETLQDAIFDARYVWNCVICRVDA